MEMENMFEKLIDSVKAKLLSDKLGVGVKNVRYKYQGEPITGQELLHLLFRIILPRFI
jgi:hypothetical protein